MSYLQLHEQYTWPLGAESFLNSWQFSTSSRNSGTQQCITACTRDTGVLEQLTVLHLAQKFQNPTVYYSVHMRHRSLSWTADSSPPRPKIPEPNSVLQRAQETPKSFLNSWQFSTSSKNSGTRSIQPTQYPLLHQALNLLFWKFWPSQRRFSILHDLGHKLSNFWCSIDEYPILHCLPIFAWVFLWVLYLEASI